MASANGGLPAISRTGSGLPSRLILHGVEGVGKSSFAASAAKPIFGMTRGETGLLTLIDNGQVSATDHFDEFDSWRALKLAIQHLIVHDTGHRTFVLDTLNGAGTLCFDYVTDTQFGGKAESFLAFGKGPEIAVREWNSLFMDLDRLRAHRRMAIVLLCHTKIKTFRNPEGEDWDRYTPDLHDKLWGPAAKWSDVILFANFLSFAKKERGEMKAKGVGNARMLYTQRTAAYDAKNRLGLLAEISMGKTPAEGWANFLTCARAGREAMKAAASTPTVAPEQAAPTAELVVASPSKTSE